MKPLQTLLAASLFLAGTIPVPAADDQHGGAHDGMDHAATVQSASPADTPAEPGQAAFAAIQEIVALLMDDPETDWDTVDIEALRRHLIDMDTVTMNARVAVEEITDGARFEVTSNDPEVQASIRAMTLAHAATMDGVDGRAFTAEETETGASLTATGDAARIRALGFIGLMTVGMHHPSHHLALARGVMPH